MVPLVDSPVRVVAVVPEPTPYRAPLFDVIAERPDIDLSVLYAADAIAANRWKFSTRHPHVILRGRRVPGAHRVLRHDYPVSPEIVRVLERMRPQVLVVTGWSTFASQAAIAWSLVLRVPFVLRWRATTSGQGRPGVEPSRALSCHASYCAPPACS